MKVLRVAILADYLEEKWPSMDLVADMLARHLSERSCGDRTIQVELIRPPMRLRFQNSLIRAGGPRLARMAWNADRLMNRFSNYPGHIRKIKSSFDVFQLADHSYSHLIHELPPGKTFTFCHDLDTFRPMFEPAKYSYFFRKMVERIFSGLQKARYVTCISRATYDQFMALKILPADRVGVVYLGTRGEVSELEQTRASQKIEALLNRPEKSVDFLHVGSTAPRKRVEFLLELFAQIRREIPNARLIRVGGAFTPLQDRQMKDLGLEGSILVMPFLTPAELDAVYKRADISLLTSDAEGFGLPVVEALACGTPVISSDLPVLQEIGGSAARYAGVGNTGAWVEQVRQTLRERALPDWPKKQRLLIAQGQKFTWENTAAQIAEIYGRVIT